MKSVLRNLWIAAAIALLCGLGHGVTLAQTPDPKFDPVFQKAKEQEAQLPDQAVQAYFKIKNENVRTNRELAADALLRSILLGYNTMDPTRPIPTSPSEKQRDDELKHQLGDKAFEAVKQMENELAGTTAAKAVEQTGLRKRLEERIDKRNAAAPSYKIIDGLVAATGRVPAFSYWFALIFIAFAVKLITWPLNLKMYKSQREMQRIQPILKDIQEKYKGKPQEMNEKVMAAYKEHGVNPFASCFPMLIQLPFLFWVYSMIRLYEHHFQNGTFLWIGSPLAQQFPNIIGANLGHFDVPLLVLYAGSNYLTMRLTPPSDPAMAQQQKTMAVMMTVMMVYFFLLYKWSAAFIFYWLILNAISTWQQYHYIYKPNKARLAAQAANGGTMIIESSGGNGSGGVVKAGGGTPATSRPLTPVPGGSEVVRTRPRRKNKK